MPIFLKNTESGRYFTGSTLKDRGKIQYSIFSDNQSQGRQFISNAEAEAVAKVIEVQVTVTEEDLI